MEPTAVEAVVGAIAEAEDTAPGQLDIVLQRWVDTDAIRQLVVHDRRSWELRFEVRDHTVRITGDETVFVDGVARRSSF